MASKNSDNCHSVTHGSSRSHSQGWAVPESDFMTGAADHTCTDQCARLHLSARLRKFEQHVQQLSMTVSVKNFLWYRNSIAAIFTTILEGNTRA